MIFRAGQADYNYIYRAWSGECLHLHTVYTVYTDYMYYNI